MAIDRCSTRRAAVPLIAVLVLMTAMGTWLVPAAAASPAPPPAPVGLPPSIADRIDAGSSHTCVVDDDAAVRCWGLNAAGALGHGDNGTLSKIRIGDDETPASAGTVDLDGTGASRVSVGANHSCAVLVDGKVACWGQNLNGILGSGDQDPNNLVIGDDEVPGETRVGLGGRTVKAISAGGLHTCVITVQDKVMCWGRGASGQLGYGNQHDIGDDEDPADAGIVDLGAGRSARSIAAGGLHTCALMDNGSVFCWGDNDHGQLGYPDIDHVGDDETPAGVGTVDLGGMKAVGLTAGSDHTCALLDNSKLRCWGSGFDSAQPPDTGHVDMGGVDVMQAGAGQDHTCAVLSGEVRHVRCWGRAHDGVLGLPGLDGDHVTPGDAPLVYLRGDSIAAVTAGDMHTCAVTMAGRVRCWGNNSVGALGNGLGEEDIGDDETPGWIGPIDLGASITWCGSRVLCTS